MLPIHQAIVLCLDLSESMNKQSGVSRPKVGHGVHEEDEFDHETASFNLLDELTEDFSEDEILESGKPHFSDRREQKKIFDTLAQLKNTCRYSLPAVTKLGSSTSKATRELKKDWTLMSSLSMSSSTTWGSWLDTMP